MRDHQIYRLEQRLDRLDVKAHPPQGIERFAGKGLRTQAHVLGLAPAYVASDHPETAPAVARHFDADHAKADDLVDIGIKPGGLGIDHSDENAGLEISHLS